MGNFENVIRDFGFHFPEEYCLLFFGRDSRDVRMNCNINFCQTKILEILRGMKIMNIVDSY